MSRLFRLSFLVVLLSIIAVTAGYAQPQVYVSGRVAPGDVRIFVKDSTYIIDRNYVIGGTLLIEPGTTVYFYPNGRIIDSVGGRILADGFANANYAANPGGLDPIGIPGSPSNPNSYSGYGDLRYFLNAGVVNSTTAKEVSVNAAKYNTIFNVVVDTVTRKVKNLLLSPTDNSAILGANDVVISPELALVYQASRLYVDPNSDIILKTRPWTRIGGASVNVTSAKIKFIGQPTDNFSREWGHFVVLPGARAAFFRNCSFDGFRKDTTVDRNDVYSAGSQPSLTALQLATLNNAFVAAENGAGGVITSYSSRLWVIDAVFTNNMARYRGGALNILQAPEGFASAIPTTALSMYDATKNPAVLNRDGSISNINNRDKSWTTNNKLYLIDAIDEPTVEPFLVDFDRQKYDDARVAMFLGRLRNLKFDGNYVQLTNVGKRIIGTNPPVEVIVDITDAAATQQSNGNNHAYGGAIFISGRNQTTEDYRNIEVGLGINNSFKRMSDNKIVSFPKFDSFEAVNNMANNYQSGLTFTQGARGGAIYVDKNTSLIIAGKLSYNRTYTKYLQDDTQGANNGTWSQGGAIFFNNPLGRLQVVGGPLRDSVNTNNLGNPTIFKKNISGNGGAIYVNNSTSTEMYTVIGGSDALVTARDLGYNIRFEDNIAYTAGGALFNRRNLMIYGAGGVEANALIGYGGKYPVTFVNNYANYAGGAIVVDIMSSTVAKDRMVRIARTNFESNIVGSNAVAVNIPSIIGGGAIFATDGDLNEVRGVLFMNNEVYNGNGGAVAYAVKSLNNINKRLFVTDVDKLDYANEVAVGYSSVNTAFTSGFPVGTGYPADTRMLTRFIGNKCHADSATLANQSGNGAVQIQSFAATTPWLPVTTANRYLNQYCPSISSAYRDMPENGVGLGGAFYMNINKVVRSASGAVPPTIIDGVIDSTFFNRVRMQDNHAFSGAAIYSDNYDSKLIFNRSLVNANHAYSTIGVNQNWISGPLHLSTTLNDYNYASSDLAPAILYGEIQGPIPAYTSPEAGNSMYGNMARFLIRLPDAPSTKGVLAGTRGIGYGGTDTIRGNYWGLTEANINMQVSIRKIKYIDPVTGDTLWFSPASQETFFIERDFDLDQTYMKFDYRAVGTTTMDPKEQGPFESIERFNYRPIPLGNKLVGTRFDQNIAADNSIPEQALFSGIVYDVHDKGTDIKTADYSKRRMSPVEDFAVGIAPIVKRYNESTYTNYPSYNKYVKRWIRDPFVAEKLNDAGARVYPWITALQDEYRPDTKGEYYHPIGAPLYLESRVDYTGLAERSNHDELMLNEAVYFVINENTGDFIRVNMKQVRETAPYREIFRARVDLVPDSTYRNTNTSFRRSTEGLYNPGVGYNLLQKLKDGDPDSKLAGTVIEDRATMAGRRYFAAGNTTNSSTLAGMADLYYNRPEMPSSNSTNVTYFAGERYRTLPTNVGDIVRIVSRTVLTREGVIKAYNDGISFKVVGSTEPPVFTGNIPKMQTDTIIKIVPSQYPDKNAAGIYDTLKITEFLNKIFVTEDRNYPVTSGVYSRNLTGLIGSSFGRDSIMRVTAVDTNKFFDPRSLADPTKYANLTYKWSVDNYTGVERWLQVDTIYAAGTMKFGAKGYIQFRGRPMNPFVVPGGENVYVRVENYPPFMNTVDALKSYMDANGNPLPQDTIDKFVNIFGSYLHARKYDVENARYLQQDTIGGGSNYANTYGYKIFVVDSIPRIILHTDPSEMIQRRTDMAGTMEDYVEYKPTELTCGMTNSGKLKANLTDKLRFQIDINSDDEMEDSWALLNDAKYGRTPWDFRFGKTAYGFMTTHLRTGDTTIVDSTIYDQDMNGADDNLVVNQTRPVWMSNNYIYQYNGEANADAFGAQFQSAGKLNIRIPAATALSILLPGPQYNGALNLDTVFSVVVTDGHGGLTTKEYPVMINVAPKILTTSLPNAKEDYDYNPQLLDSNRMIKIFDPNFDQDHRFELVYSDYALNTLPLDPCYAEAGSIDLVPLKTTPKWLKINPVSGLLYGTPGVKDAPKSEKVTIIVWDRIDDKNELPALITLDLQVDSTNHNPSLLTAPISKCVDKDMAYSDTLYVSDRDLMRGKNASESESLTLTVIDPAGMQITPNKVTGVKSESDLPVKVIISAAAFNGTPGTDGRITIKVRVVDASGVADTLIYKVKLSETTNFVTQIKVENSKGAYQMVEFGTAKLSYSPTTGDGSSQADDYVGKLDSNFCEFELPPTPHKDIFDTRWTISTKNGILRNIFPEATSKTKAGEFVYRAHLQAGGESGNTANHYPVKITWDMNSLPARTDNAKNPSGASWWIRDAVSNGNVFNYNMREGYGYSAADIKKEVTGTNFSLVIMRDAIEDFIIVYDWITDVENPTVMTNPGISSINPNPVNKQTQINFGVNTANRIKIDLFDALGNRVAAITDGDYTVGSYSIVWTARDLNGNDLPSGSYTVRMTSAGNTSSYQMVIVK